MKGNQTDDLFRQKLSHQKLTPPPAAWSAIEQNLPGKKKKGAYFWMSIAASILVIFTIGWLVLDKGANPSVIGPETQAKVEETKEPTIKAPAAAEVPAQDLVAKISDKPEVIKPVQAEPKLEQLVAQNNSATRESSAQAPIQKSIVKEALIRRVPLEVNMISLDERLTPAMTAREFRFDMIMPLDVTAYYIPYTEDIELAPRKRKFRVLNGIISVAKEVNSGKLRFQELRNAKNNFVEGDLKYGTKEADSDSGEDEPEPPGKE